jgi:hypothetical protein
LQPERRMRDASACSKCFAMSQYPQSVLLNI